MGHKGMLRFSLILDNGDGTGTVRRLELCLARAKTDVIRVGRNHKCEVVVKMGAISNTHLEFRLAPAKEFYNIGGSGWCLAVRDVSANGSAIIFNREGKTLARRLTKDAD